MAVVSGSSDTPKAAVSGENTVAALRGPGGSLLFPARGGLDCYGVLGSTLVGTAGVAGMGGDNGVYGHSSNKSGSGVYGDNEGGGFGVAGRSLKRGGVGIMGEGERYAGLFNGTVQVNRDLVVDGSIVVRGEIRFEGGDAAEEFPIHVGAEIAAGSVLVIDDSELLTLCAAPYDRRVAGVVSNGGRFKPALVLSSSNASIDRVRIALAGKVYCRIDARYGAIKPGDLLTTSETPGCAMKATEWPRAFGATIGKAIAPLTEGIGLVPILATLQ
jgi:hypothetical protein